MTDRDRLINIVDEYTESLSVKDLHSLDFADKFADYLLANGVKLSAELQNKCGSCVYAKPVIAFGKSKCYVNCTNKEHIERFCQREISTLRLRTNPACKKYKELKDNA